MMKCFMLILSLWTTMTFAAVPEWKIVPEKSSLKFTATQNNAPVSGEFKKFTGTIIFDPNDLANSNIKIIVDLNSLQTSYTELTDTLKSDAWFDIKLFPRATFKAKKFTKSEGNNYQAHGTLVIRDKSIPVTLNFVLDQYDPTSAHATGNAELQRTLFGVGQGEWAKTNEVKDEVTINFDLTAQK